MAIAIIVAINTPNFICFLFFTFHLLNMYGEELLCDFSILIDFSYVNNPFYKPFPYLPSFSLIVLQCCRVGGRQYWRHFRGRLWRWENGM